MKANLTSLKGNTVDVQSRSVLADLIKDEHLKDADSVALFMSMPKVEIDTLGIIDYCMANGKNVFLPRCFLTESGKSEMTFLKVSSMEEVANLKPEGKYNLRQPTGGQNVFDDDKLDVMIIPGVAFTESGDRLGHGAGYYDKFLSLYLKSFGVSPFLIGVGLREQLVHSIPTEIHDWKMDRVIIGKV